MPRPERQEARAPSVLLVSMPWTTVIEPSLGLGILKAVLEQRGIPCRVLHVNLFLLEHLRATTYEALSIGFALNDFLFSGTLDPTVSNQQLRWLRWKVREVLNDGAVDPGQVGGSEGLMRILLRLRSEVLPAWLERWSDEIAAHDATLVGFSCMFDQTIASLALARMVRDRAPTKMLALGGVAVRAATAQMIVRASSWIDAVCEGEGEVTVVELARALAGEIELAAVPGIVCRSPSNEPVSTPAPAATDLDANPDPDFDDYFADLRRLNEEYQVDISPPNLPIENSRGCWWGAKSHCVFCGIRGEDMAFRARDARSVLATMANLSRRHGIDGFRFSDYILPSRYFETLLPELARMGGPYRLSTEAKANITDERFELLARAGFYEVQLGIESFSTGVLRKMSKGVSAVQNVHSLLLGRRLGVRVLYNLLYGFPDDDPAEYERMAAQLPNLIHLDPPVTCVPVQITRFAPLQADPERFGIARAEPDPCYELVFSREYLERTGFDVSKFCYYFERPFENATALHRIYQRLDVIANEWQRVAEQRLAWLYGEPDDGELVIHDRRTERENVYRIDPPAVEILNQCASPVSMRALYEANPSLPVDDLVAELAERGLIFRDEQRLISLVLPGAPAVEDAQVERQRDGSATVVLSN